MDAGKSNIFWGLIVKPSKRYETTVQEAFRITKACIEPASAKGDVSSVFVECDNQEEFIVANLQSKNLNESLDLTFGVGEKICFKVEGPGTVHLTGYLMEDDQPPNDFYMDDSAMESSGESEDEEVQTNAKETDEKEALKRKTAPQDEVKKKKLKLETESKQESSVKAKQAAETSVNKESEDDSSEDESSDEDSSEPAETTIDTTLGDLDDTENFAEEEDSDSEDDDDSDDSDEEEADTSGSNIILGDTTLGSDDDSSDDEEYTPPPKKESPKKEKTPSKAKANGDAKPVEQNKKPAVETPAKTPDVPKSEKKKKEKANSTETPKKTSIVNGDSDISKSEKKKKKEATATPNVKQEAPKTPKQEKKDKEPKTPKQAETPKDPKTPVTNGKTPKPGETPGKTPKRTLKGGIQSEDSVVGTGPEVTPGSTVGMYYSGKLKSNNKKFDSCKEGKPFKFKIGKGEVIKGWDIGIMGMKVGGKRTLVIPPQMGYGGAGAPPDIPGNATLVFDVECKFVK